MFSRVFVYLQYALPRHWLTALTYRIARIRLRGVKNTLIKTFVRLYKVNVKDVAKHVPDDFTTFNDFFIRELAPGARAIDTDAIAIVSPVDGTVSQAARLEADSILQAKGLDYSLDDLFAIDLDEARAYSNGSFATIYLAPYNYHRVHMPLDGELTAAHYVPGDLFSVNDSTAANLPGLFHRNERLNLHFRTAFGPAALVFVGALNVGSISTPWTGEIRPRKSGVVETLDISRSPRDLAKGDLLGWFNMGSTVILVLPEGVAEWHATLLHGRRLTMGERIGEIVSAPL